MEIVNLTPHPLNIKTVDDRIITIQPSGELARVSESREQLPVINHREGNISVTRATYGEIENLPDPEDGKIFVVSALVLARARGRNDVFAPGLAIRDEAGRVIGCDGLSAAPTV
jgi:hypothetical protein